MASVSWWHDVDVANLVRKNQIKIKTANEKLHKRGKKVVKKTYHHHRGFNLREILEIKNYKGFNKKGNEAGT